MAAKATKQTKKPAKARSSSKSPRRKTTAAMPKAKSVLKKVVPAPVAATSAFPEPVARPKGVTVERSAPEPATEDETRSRYDGDSAIKLYLREIGKVPLLTPQQEIELAARIKKALAAK